MSVIPITFEEYSKADFQLEDLDRLADNKASANWSEMGCYKTTSALWLAQNRFNNLAVKNPALLIVTSKNGKGTYFDAIPKTLPDWTFINVHTQKVTKVELGQFEFEIDGKEFAKLVLGEKPTVVLAHYHCFTNKAQIKDVLYAITWDMIVLDEAHRIKDRDAQWTRGLKQLKTDEEKGTRHVMTGTGFVNRPDELWSLLNFVDRKEWSSYWNFRKEYCWEEVDFVTGYTMIKGIKPEKLDDFRALRKQLGPRRRLSEVRPDISEPIFTTITVDLNPTQKKMYDEIRDYLYTLDQNGTPIVSPNVLSQLNRLRQISVATPEKIDEWYDEKHERRVQEIRLVEPSSKLDAVEELLDSLEWDEENRQQLVVFSCFKAPLDMLEYRLYRKKIPYLHMKAEMNEKDRYRMWHDEWFKKEHRVFLTSLQLGAESINLSSAERAVFLDRSWSPKDNMQAIGRIYRPGQTGQAQIIYIEAKATVDARVLRLNEIKGSWFKDVFGEE
jgi:Superfamily II DNA/RNA helicases, SNF2 family